MAAEFPRHQRSASMLDNMRASISKFVRSRKQGKPDLSQEIFYSEFMSILDQINSCLHSKNNGTSPIPGYSCPSAVVLYGNPDASRLQNPMQSLRYLIALDLTNSRVKFPAEVLSKSESESESETDKANNTNNTKLGFVVQTGASELLLQPEHALFSVEQIKEVNKRQTTDHSTCEEVCSIELFVYNSKIKCENAKVTLLQLQNPSEKTAAKHEPESKASQELQAQKELSFKCVYKTQATINPSSVKMTGLSTDVTEHFFSVVSKKDGSKICTLHWVVPENECVQITENIVIPIKKKKSIRLRPLMKRFAAFKENEVNRIGKVKIASFLKDPYRGLERFLEFVPIKTVTKTITIESGHANPVKPPNTGEVRRVSAAPVPQQRISIVQRSTEERFTEKRFIETPKVEQCPSPVVQQDLTIEKPIVNTQKPAIEKQAVASQDVAMPKPIVVSQELAVEKPQPSSSAVLKPKPPAPTRQAPRIPGINKAKPLAPTRPAPRLPKEHKAGDSPAPLLLSNNAPVSKPGEHRVSINPKNAKKP